MSVVCKNLKISGINLKYREAGDPNAKQTIIVLHGWSHLGAKNWERFISIFDAKEYRLIAPDLPGMGDSQAPPQIWHAEDFADFMIAFAEKLELKKYILVGHSFGGAVSAIWTSKTKKVTNLVLVAPAIVRGQEGNQKVAKASSLGKKIMNFALFKPFYNQTRNIWHKLSGARDYNLSRGIMKDIMQVVIREDLQHFLAKIKIPTLILWGDKDEMTPPQEAQKIKNQLKDGHLIMYPSLNHGLHIHAPEWMERDITDFLEGKDLQED